MGAVTYKRRHTVTRVSLRHLGSLNTQGQSMEADFRCHSASSHSQRVALGCGDVALAQVKFRHRHASVMLPRGQSSTRDGSGRGAKEETENPDAPVGRLQVRGGPLRPRLQHTEGQPIAGQPPSCAPLVQLRGSLYRLAGLPGPADPSRACRQH